MKKKMQILILSQLLFGLAGGSALAKSDYVTGNYQVDSMHSKVGFEVPHLVISSVEGKFNAFEGSVDLKEKFEDSKVTASVDVKSVDTGVEKRDEHLRSKDFFEVEKFPKMKFVSQSIKGNLQKFTVTGDLTIKDKTKKVSFDGKFLGSVVDGWGNQKIAADLKTKINRKDFGLTWNSMVEAGPVVGDEVEIELKIQAALPKGK